LAFAIIQDLFEGERARRKRSYVTAVFGTVPILAPALGTWISGLAGWRAVHGILVLAGLVLLAVVLLGSVGQAGRPRSASLDLTSVAVRLRDDYRFIGLALVNALSYGSIFAYIAGLPVVMIGYLGYTPAAYAAVFASTAAALTLGAWTNGRIVPRYVEATRALNACLVTAALASLALIACYVARLDGGVVLLLLLLIALFCRGMIAPNLQHSAIERRRDQAGVASAAIGVSQILMGALTSAVVAFLIPNLKVLAVAAPMSALTASAVAVWWWLNRQEVAVELGG
jgi:DHA1 family bicyclomycin/chloramphenicol resistance-like MFS transporter